MKSVRPAALSFLSTVLGACQSQSAPERAPVPSAATKPERPEAETPAPVPPPPPPPAVDPAVADPAEPTQAELDAAEEAGPGFPKVAAFKNSPRGVRLRQDDDGTVKAKSTKPETQGRTYIIDLIMADGLEKTIRVTAQ